MNGDALVALDGVSFHYNGEPVIDQVSMAIRRGDFVGIIGPNGSGKTTLLKIVLGLLKPQSGVVTLFGQRQAQFRQQEKVGYVPQRLEYRNLRFPITAEEIVSMGRIGRSSLLFGFSREDKQAIDEALRVVGLDAARKTLITHLSGGQQQRVFIARALAARPELLLLDEPTVGVDVETQDKFYGLLRTLNRERSLTIVLVSHDLDVLGKEVRTLAYLNRRLVYYGPTGGFRTPAS